MKKNPAVSIRGNGAGNKRPKASAGRTQPRTAEQNAARAWMLKKIAESGLDEHDAEALGFKPFTADESISLNLPRREGTDTGAGAGAGFQIPYCNPNGQPIDMFRYRYQITKVKSGFLKETELNKYAQPFESDPDIYLPHLPGVEWSVIKENTDQPLIATEGELKAASATKHVMPTFGLGGVFNFQRKKRYQMVIPSLDEFKWAGRLAYIIFDRKAEKNEQVEIAENRLARRLVDRGAIVKVVHLPLKGQDEMKLDDFIVKYGKDELLKVIEDTPEWGPVGALHEMNEDVVYIMHPSMILTMPQEDHPKSQPRYRSTSVNKFKIEQFIDRTYFNAERKTRLTANDWIKWPHRKKADSVTFEPGAPQFIGNQFNLWEGWGAEDVAGDVSLFDKFFDHIMQGLLPEHKKWMLQWFAYPIQHPGTRLNTAVVVWSDVQGSGKSLLGLTMKGIYGHGFREINQKQIEGGFNPWMKVAQFILADEIAGGDSRKLADWLKSTITAVEVTINEKYVPHFTVRNRCNYYFTSNHQDAFYLENHDRRYFVHEITAPRLSDEFFLEYGKWMQSETGRNALMHFFRSVDLAGFNPHAEPPVTAAKEAMKEVSRSGVEQWCIDLFNDPGSMLRAPGGVPLKRDVYTADELLEIYFSQNPAANIGGATGLKAKGISTALRKAGFKRTDDSVLIPNAPANKPKKARLWVINNRSKLETLTGTQLAALYAWQLNYPEAKKPSKVEYPVEAAGS